MGSIHKASCKCGFEASVRVGGTRSSFLESSYFPFFCENCGLVSINIAPLKDGCSRVKCPECKKLKAYQYGKVPASRLSSNFLAKWFLWLWRPASEPKVSIAFEWGNRKAAEHGNICPSCRQYSLTFQRMADLMYD